MEGLVFGKAWLFLLESTAEDLGKKVTYVKLERKGKDGGTTILEKGAPSKPAAG